MPVNIPFNEDKAEQVGERDNKKKVLVIGAGPCGLSQLRAFQSEESQLKPNETMPEIVCYEKQADMGGLWNYSWRTGSDEYGEYVHNSMYRNLWSNGPKECLEFADYSFEKHFGKPIPSYPPRAVLADYIKGRAESAGLRKFICFETVVKRLDYNEETEKFAVTAHSYQQNKTFTEQFDNVIVATGHFSVPNVPQFEGFSTFNGRIIHAHDFRNAEDFRGKRILIVGSSYSGEDIASQCHKFGASKIVCSYRTAPMDYNWPDSFVTCPNLTKITNGSTANFADGSSHEVDAIILCTGYQHKFPFIEDDALRLETGNTCWIDDLYRGIFKMQNPKLMYLGMHDQWYTFNMFDAQAWLARDYVLGRLVLPSKIEMESENNEWSTVFSKVETGKESIIFQGNYVKSLVAETNYPDFDVDKMNETFFAWKHDKQVDIFGYRNISYPSVITGTQSPKHHTTWLQEFDDSKEAFLGEKKLE